MNLLSLVLAATLPAREWANETITPIPTTRLNDILMNIGNTSVRTDGPNWGSLLFNLLAVYTDSAGIIAYVVLFAIPFIMMWIAQSDMTLPAIVGMMFSIYCFAMLPQQYILFSTGCFVICVAGLLWSLYRRAY